MCIYIFINSYIYGTDRIEDLKCGCTLSLLNSVQLELLYGIGRVTDSHTSMLFETSLPHNLRVTGKFDPC